MGLVNFLLEKYAVGLFIDTLKEKYPPLLVFIDSLDEKSLPACIADLVDAHKSMIIQQISEAPDVDIPFDKYIGRFLCETPCIFVILDLLKDFGITELFGTSMSEIFKELDLDSGK